MWGILVALLSGALMSVQGVFNTELTKPVSYTHLGLTASGADVYLLHVTTTPSVSYVVRTEDFDCGIMISASHNPFYDNGIKIINGNGQKMEAAVEEQIEAYIDGKLEELPLAKKENIGRTVDFSAGRNCYIGYLISIPTRAFKNVRVGLDCSNGSASAIAKSVFDALGAKTYVIHNEPNGVNINTNCGSTHIEQPVSYTHLDAICDVMEGGREALDARYYRISKALLK